MGLIPRRLPFTQVDNNIRYFRHALSLDEHRVWVDISLVILNKSSHCRKTSRFKPSTWYRPTHHDHEKGLKSHEMPRSKGHDINVHRTQAARLRHLEREYTAAETVTDVEEVWFAGCHCGTCIYRCYSEILYSRQYKTDVGGGSVVNGTRNSLARIPLRWMIRQCFLANTGIMFHKDTLPKVGLDPSTIYPEVLLPRPPMVCQDPKVHTIPVPEPKVVDDDRKAVVYTDGNSFVNEAEEDLADALTPMYDQLKLAKYWWLLEIIPQKIQFQSSENNKTVRKITYVDLHFCFLVC